MAAYPEEDRFGHIKSKTILPANLHDRIEEALNDASVTPDDHCVVSIQDIGSNNLLGAFTAGVLDLRSGISHEYAHDDDEQIRRQRTTLSYPSTLHVQR